MEAEELTESKWYRAAAKQRTSEKPIGLVDVVPRPDDRV
jgi:hypothetical protein